MEPPVSEPNPTKPYPAATAAPVPPEEPAGVRAGSCGFRVIPPSELMAPPDANSLRFTFASTMAPASLSLRTTKASSGGRESWSRKDPAVVGMSAVSKLSLRSTGIPWSGERRPDRSRSASIARARSRAFGFTEMTALIRGP